MDSPALSPDGTRVAFVATGRQGTRDVWVLEDGRVERLTDDGYAERQVAWGEAGIVYTSDATERVARVGGVVKDPGPPSHP